MAKTPQEQTDELLIAVGNGLRSWSGVEDAVVMVFSEAMGRDRHHLNVLIMNAILSFEARVSVCNQVVRHVLKDDPELPVWNKLIARVLKFYKKRHELAHFDIIMELSDSGGPGVMQFQPFGLFPSLAANARSTLSVAQINERAEKFGELRDGLLYFFWNHFVEGPGEEFVPIVPDLILRLRTLAVQKPAEPQPVPTSIA